MHQYRNGNYIVMFDGRLGTKYRYSRQDILKPKFAENMDLTITRACDGGCPFCYEGCTPTGKHADLRSYQWLFDTMHPYTEVAINGNDLSHPDLEWLLTYLKNKRIFTNITVHEKHFLKNYNQIMGWYDRGLVHGIGVSLDYAAQNHDVLIKYAKSIPTAVIHVIAGIVSEHDIDVLKDNSLHLLILGYKDINRGKNWIEQNSNDYERNLSYLRSNLLSTFLEFSTVSLDTLALKQLSVADKVSKDYWNTHYLGDDGEFTFYLDLVNGEYAKNSFCDTRKPIQNGMSVDDMFHSIRSEDNK